MSKISSTVNKNSDGYKRNFAYHTELGAQLRERIDPK